MNSLSNSQDTLVKSATAAQRLVRAINVACGEFSLILVCCESVPAKQQILKCFKQYSTVAIKEIRLSPTDETLYTTIKNNLRIPYPEALVVHGLESVIAINQLLISTNLMRDEFRKSFNFPLVLFVNDEILSKLVWLAPDLKNWAATTIRFDVSQDTLVKNKALTA